MRPTQPLFKALRRLPLTTKQGPHNYYKGNRTGAMGRHTKHGRYIISYDKVRTYVCPDLTDFHLTPFVSKRVEKWKDSFPRTTTTTATTHRPLDGKEYLRKWKAVVGHNEHGRGRGRGWALKARGGAGKRRGAGYEADMRALMDEEGKAGGEARTKGKNHGKGI